MLRKVENSTKLISYKDKYIIIRLTLVEVKLATIK